MQRFPVIRGFIVWVCAVGAISGAALGLGVFRLLEGDVEQGRAIFWSVFAGIGLTTLAWLLAAALHVFVELAQSVANR